MGIYLMQDINQSLQSGENKMETRNYVQILKILPWAVFLTIWTTTAWSQNEENQTDQEEQPEQGQVRSTGTTVHISPAELTRIQQALSDLGYEPGNVEGVWDEGTSSALRDFQQQIGLAPTGELNFRTLTWLFRSTEAEANAGAGGGPQPNGDQQQFGAGNRQPVEAPGQQVDDESLQQPVAVQQESSDGEQAQQQFQGDQAQASEGGRARQPLQEDQEQPGLSRQEDALVSREELPYGYPYRPGYVYQPGFIYERGFPQPSRPEGQELPRQQYLGLSPEWQGPQGQTQGQAGGAGGQQENPSIRQE